MIPRAALRSRAAAVALYSFFGGFRILDTSHLFDSRLQLGALFEHFVCVAVHSVEPEQLPICDVALIPQ